MSMASKELLKVRHLRASRGSVYEEGIVAPRERMVTAEVRFCPVPRVLPSFAVQRSLVFSDAHSQQFPLLDGRVVLPASLKAASIRRKIEFVAGRLCALDAIRGLAPSCIVGQVGRTTRGLPEWPSGCVGSITHTGGYASAAVAFDRDASGIGIDSECFVARTVANDITSLVATPRELAAATEQMCLAPHEALVLLFVTKEAIFKCLHPLWGLFFDFLDVEIRDLDLKTSTFAARVLSGDPSELAAEIVLQGTFAVDDARCHAGVAVTER
jgi:enterobactin synthetase component D